MLLYALTLVPCIKVHLSSLNHKRHLLFQQYVQKDTHIHIHTRTYDGGSAGRAPEVKETAPDLLCVARVVYFYLESLSELKHSHLVSQFLLIFACIFLRFLSVKSLNYI